MFASSIVCDLLTSFRVRKNQNLDMNILSGLWNVQVECWIFQCGMDSWKKLIFMKIINLRVNQNEYGKHIGRNFVLARNFFTDTKLNFYTTSFSSIFTQLIEHLKKNQCSILEIFPISYFFGVSIKYFSYFQNMFYLCFV